jgi:hypothetical protein
MKNTWAKLKLIDVEREIRDETLIHRVQRPHRRTGSKRQLKIAVEMGCMCLI